MKTTAGLYLCNECGCLTDRETCTKCNPPAEPTQEEWIAALKKVVED